MKKIILISLMLTNLLLSGQDFRNAKWGSTMSQVKSTESGKLIKETSEYIIYQTKLTDFDVYAIYIFAGNKLVRAKYSLLESHTNKNDYISDYNTLKSLLTKKYGNPTEDENIWKNDLYKNN